MAYCPLATPIVKDRPRAQKIQPTGFFARRETTKAPTVANDMNNSKPQISKTSGVW
jgi:hypothetical protein